MKLLSSLTTICLLTSEAQLSADSFKDLNLTANDLAKVLELSVNKYHIDFTQPGTPTLQIKSMSHESTVSLPVTSKSATIVWHSESDSDGKGLSRVHYWFTSEGHTTYSSFIFEDAKNKVRSCGLKDGVFTIAGKSSTESKKQDGFTLKIISVEQDAAPNPLTVE